MTEQMISADRIVHSYASPGGGRITALNGVTFGLSRGKTLGIVGASGAGKSTLVRLLLGLESPDSGHILVNGTDLNLGSKRERRKLRMRLQAVFQDPRSSLNPHLSLRSIVEEPILARARHTRHERLQMVDQALSSVGLDPSIRTRRPEALSGGERQRVAIARALVTAPEVLILDEPVSALDGPIRSQILDLLTTLKVALNLTVILVSHDVRSTLALADTVMVLYAGVCVESGSAKVVFSDPTHPYTQALIEAVPDPKDNWEIPEVVVNAGPASSGCACQSWCPLASIKCATAPDLKPIKASQNIACWEIPGLA